MCFSLPTGWHAVSILLLAAYRPSVESRPAAVLLPFASCLNLLQPDEKVCLFFLAP